MDSPARWQHDRIDATLPRLVIAMFCGLAVCLLLGCGRWREAGSLVALPQPPPSPASLVEAMAESGSPRADRDWKPTHAILPHAEFRADGVTIHHVRQCQWQSESEVLIRHQAWTFGWDEVRGLDFVVVPFQTAPLLAHTMFSFELADGRHLMASVEARLERGESYSAVAGAARRFELMYVLGSEQDLLGLRGEVRRDDVFLYRSIATPAQSAKLLRDVLRRTNALSAQPEFYDSISNNCTTNLVDHINRLKPGSIPDNFRKMLPGHSDAMAYQLGLLATEEPFPVARRRANVTMRIRQHLRDPDFSQKIRGHVPL